MGQVYSIVATVRAGRIEAEVPTDWREGQRLRIELVEDEFEPSGTPEPTGDDPEAEKRQSASASQREADDGYFDRFLAKNKVGELLGQLLIRDFDEDSDDILIIEKIVDLLSERRGRSARFQAALESMRRDDDRRPSDPRRPRLDRFGLERPGREDDEGCVAQGSSLRVITLGYASDALPGLNAMLTSGLEGRLMRSPG